MSDILTLGEQHGLIRFNDDRSRITYLLSDPKTYGFKDPEELVRAETFVELILDYKYPVNRIRLEVQVPRRTPNDWADIVVFDDDDWKKPHIVVECKRQAASDAEFTQAIEQGFGNANSLNAPFLLVTCGLKSVAFNVRDFPPLERIANIIARLPFYGETGKTRAKFYKGGLDEHGKPAFDLEEVEQSELTKIFQYAHQSLWAGGKRNPSEAFDEFDKIIFCKLWDEEQAKYRKLGTPYDFQEFTGESAETLYQRIVKVYEEGRREDPEVFKETIRLSPTELKTIVGYLAPVNLLASDLDSKGRAFETFMTDFFRGDFGQYFTPRPVVDFIVKVLPIDRRHMVLDTSCGSGGFLLYALNKVRDNARRARAGGAIASDADEKTYWHDFAKTKLFGIEISESIARTAKMNMKIHDDGHTNVIAFDGLAPDTEMQKINDRFRFGAFDFILTNPPFGSVVKQAEQAYMKNYGLAFRSVNWIDSRLKGAHLRSPRETQSTEVLFIEQCHNFLRPGGILAIVVPDGVLTNSSQQEVRDWIEEHYRLAAVISLPQTTFTHTGAGVKSSILFLQKLSADQTERIQSLKQTVGDNIWARPEAAAAWEALELEKNDLLMRGVGLEEFMQLEAPYERLPKPRQREVQKTEGFKLWRAELSSRFKDRFDDLRETLDETRRREVGAQLDDYPVFMAIVEQIGYDATGRPTGRNELEDIVPQLADFIQRIYANSRDAAFFG